MRLYQRGRTWWVTFGSKPQRRVSTGTSDYSKAQEMAIRIIGPSMLEKEGELLERAAKAKRDAREAESGLKRLDGCFTPEGYAMHHGCKMSNAMLAQKYWRRFVAFCAARGVHHIERVTEDICSAFISTLGGRSAQLGSIYCKAIIKDAGCSRELFRKVRRTEETTHREPLTRAQIETLLAEADKGLSETNPAKRSYPDEFSAYIRFLIYSGLRMGDAATILKKDYDPGLGIIRRRMSKTGKTVEFPLHPAIEPFFKASLEKDGEYVFNGLAGLYNSHPDALTLRIRRLFRRSGISGAPGQYCAHCLRTTFASICAEHGIPLAVIQSWLGHTSPMVTRIYARIEDMKRKREALERFPDLG